jgi:hypothetical protein
VFVLTIYGPAWLRPDRPSLAEALSEAQHAREGSILRGTAAEGS